MTMKQKNTALILAAIMLATSLVASCGSTETPEGDTTTGETTTASAEKERDPIAELGDHDLGGRTIRMLSHHDALSDERTIWSTEMNGDMINDIIYKRNSDVQDMYNFKLEMNTGDGWAADYSKLKNSVLAGSRDYDLCFLLPFAARANIVIDGLMYNMLEVPHLRFDEAWWHRNVNDLFTFDGYLPFVSSDMLLSSYQYANTLIFNKKIADDYGLNDIYDVVRSGKWTLDKFAEYAEKTSADLNANGKADVEDRFGFATNFGYHAITWQYAIGEITVRLDPKEGVELGLKDERFYNLAEWMYDLFYNSGSVFEIEWDKECDIKWDEDRVFMQAIWVNDLEKFRSYRSEFGVIPYAKYDETQEGYYTYVDARAGGLAIPVDCDEQTIDDDGLIIEAMSYLSYRDLIPAYLESVTSSKLTRDEDSIEMLEIINAGRRWDIGYTMSEDNSYTWVLRTSLKKSGGKLASTLESMTDKTVANFEKVLEAYKGLSELYK